MGQCYKTVYHGNMIFIQEIWLYITDSITMVKSFITLAPDVNAIKTGLLRHCRCGEKKLERPSFIFFVRAGLMLEKS